MKALLILLWFSLLLGQLGAIPLEEGVMLYVQDIVLTLTALVAILRYGLLGKLRKARLTGSIGLFAAVGVVSLLVNVTQYPVAVTGKGSLYLLRWVMYALFYGVVLASSFSATFWLLWLGSFGTALSAVGLVQFVWYPDLRNLWYGGWDPHYYRVFATLLDPNYVGILLVLTLLVLVFVFRRWVLPAVIVGSALLLSYSRSSYLALLGGIGAAIVLLKRWKEGVLLTLFFLLAVVYVPKPGGETLSLDRYDSTVSRFQNWGQTIARIGERPVFGFGFNVLPFLGNAGVDSSLLFVGVTTGIVGLTSYVWLLYGFVHMAQESKNSSVRMLVLVSLTALFVHSLFVNSLFYPWVMVWLWVLVGVAEKSQRV